jgi:hypothetical protein
MANAVDPDLAAVAKEASQQLRETNRETQLITLRKMGEKFVRALVDGMKSLGGKYELFSVYVNGTNMASNDTLPAGLDSVYHTAFCAVTCDTTNERADKHYCVAIRGMDFVILEKSEPRDRKKGDKVEWKEFQSFTADAGPDVAAVASDAKKWLAQQIHDMGS